MNWEVKKLGDVCEIFNGSTPLKSNKQYWDNGTINWFTIKDIRSQGRTIKYTEQKITSKALTESSIKLLPVNTVLICCTASVGEWAITDIELTTNQQFNGMVVKNKDKVISKYLYYFSSTLKDKLINVSGKTTIDFVSMTKLKQIEIPLPSLPIQKQIVSILDNAFEKLNLAKKKIDKNLKNSKDIFESYLQQIFESKGDDWEKMQLSYLLERGWISSHLDGNHGGDYPRKEEFVNEGIPYISAKCLKGNFIDFSLAKYLTLKRAAKIKKGIAINNDVLFAHNATVGPVTILKTEKDKIILGTSLTYYRCNLNYILPAYLVSYMRSKEFKNQYELVMRQSTRNQVPITKQREFYHIIPPLDIQKEIAIKTEFLSEKTKKLEAIYNQKLADLEELRKSILQKAFAGELIVEK